MIKVKTFIPDSSDSLQAERLDRMINGFIKNNAVEVIDIKYSVVPVGGITCGIKWMPSAMLIYKDKAE